MGRAKTDVGYVPPIRVEDAHNAAINVVECALHVHGDNHDKVVADTALVLERLGIKEMCNA